MVGAEGVLEAGMSGARVDEEGVTELPDVAQTLEGGGVHHPHRGRLQADVVPERVADDLGAQPVALHDGASLGTAARFAAKLRGVACARLTEESGGHAGPRVHGGANGAVGGAGRLDGGLGNVHRGGRPDQYRSARLGRAG